MSLKYIKRKSAVKPITGSISDTTNITDKTKNTYSARIIDEKIGSGAGSNISIVYTNTVTLLPDESEL